MTFSWKEDLLSFVTPFADHFHIHAVSLVFWLTIHFVSGYYYQHKSNVFQMGYDAALEKESKKGDKKKSNEKIAHRVKMDLMVKTVALIHAVISSSFAFYAFCHPSRVFGEITYEDAYRFEPIFYYGNAISAGYFLYDFVIALYDFDIPFLIHGSLSYAIFGHSVRPFLNFIGGLYLVYEVSTIFLNIRFLMITTGNTKNKYFNIIQYTFFGSFITVRMFFGTFHCLYYMQPFLYKLATDQLGDSPHSYIAVYICSFSNFALQSLNIMWTFMMIKAIQRQIKGDTQKKIEKTE